MTTNLELAKRLIAIVHDDHVRGCAGRSYSCGGSYTDTPCTYDVRKDALIMEVADFLSGVK
jgi:hypothetical protein